MKPDLQFTSIKLVDEKVALEWEQRFGDLSAKTTLDADVAPSPEFAAALAGFKPEVLKLLGLPKTVAWVETLVVRKVGIKRNGEGELRGRWIENGQVMGWRLVKNEG